MYVMSSLPPAQQSLAGGIFNTVTKLCSAVGLGISASIYNAESEGTAALQTTIRPYHTVFWFCVASSALALIFVPWLSIGTQGHSQGSSIVDMDVSDKIVDVKRGEAEKEMEKEVIAEKGG